MINKLILPAVATVLLGGCMTDGYSYRHARGAGDYYYGQPSVDYRYYGSPYGYYGYGPYRYGLYGYRDHYGYGGYGYGYPYYPGYYWRPHPGHGDHDDGDGDDHEPRPDDDNPPPWRDLGDLRMRKSGNTPPQRVAPTRSAPQVPRRVATPTPPPPPPPSSQAPRSQSHGDSRIERMIDRARRDSDSGERRTPL